MYNSVTCDFARETRLVLLPEAFPTKVAPPTGRETRKLSCLSNRDLATKLTQLQLTRDKTEAVLTSRNGNRIKRNRDALFAVVTSVDRAKRKMEELKIAAGEGIPDINTWDDKVDVDTAAVNDDMERMFE